MHLRNVLREHGQLVNLYAGKPLLDGHLCVGTELLLSVEQVFVMPEDSLRVRREMLVLHTGS